MIRIFSIAIVVCLSTLLLANTPPLSLETSTPFVQSVIIYLTTDKLTLTDEVKAEFWREFAYLKPLTPEKKERVMHHLIGKEFILTSYFYKDTLTALYLERPFKSEQRQRYENTLEQYGIITEKELREYEVLQRNIIKMKIQEFEKKETYKTTRENLEKLMSLSHSKMRALEPLFK